MSNTLLIWIVTVLYLTQGSINVYNGMTAQAVIMAGYCLANLGLILTFK